MRNTDFCRTMKVRSCIIFEKSARNLNDVMFQDDIESFQDFLLRDGPVLRGVDDHEGAFPVERPLVEIAAGIAQVAIIDRIDAILHREEAIEVFRLGVVAGGDALLIPREHEVFVDQVVIFLCVESEEQ